MDRLIKGNKAICEPSLTCPLYVDLGSIYDVDISHVGLFTVTYTDGSNKVTFSYSSPLDTPTIV